MPRAVSISTSVIDFGGGGLVKCFVARFKSSFEMVLLISMTISNVSESSSEWSSGTVRRGEVPCVAVVVRVGGDGGVRLRSGVDPCLWVLLGLEDSGVSSPLSLVLSVVIFRGLIASCSFCLDFPLLLELFVTGVSVDISESSDRMPLVGVRVTFGGVGGVE